MAKKKFEGFDDILIDDELLTSLPIEDASAFDINLIEPNPYQPRFNENVDELKASILSVWEDLQIDNNRIIPCEDGLLQPIIITSNTKGTYTCVGGHRRLKACKQLNHQTIKANLITIDERQMQSFAIVENLQREDLTPFETALAIDNAMNSGSYKSAGDLARALGKTAPWLSKCRSVLKLSPTILEDIQKEKVKIGLEILVDLQRIKDSQGQCELYFDYKNGKITQSDIRAKIALEKNNYEVVQPLVRMTSKNIKLNFNWEFLNDDKKANFEIELSNLIIKNENT